MLVHSSFSPWMYPALQFIQVRCQIRMHRARSRWCPGGMSLGTTPLDPTHGPALSHSSRLWGPMVEHHCFR